MGNPVSKPSFVIFSQYRGQQSRELGRRHCLCVSLTRRARGRGRPRRRRPTPPPRPAPPPPRARLESHE